MRYSSVAANPDAAAKGGRHVHQTFDNLRGWPAIPATLAWCRRLVRSKTSTNRTLEVPSAPLLLRFLKTAGHTNKPFQRSSGHVHLSTPCPFVSSVARQSR